MAAIVHLQEEEVFMLGVYALPAIVMIGVAVICSAILVGLVVTLPFKR